jgi:hypothetical protein
MMVFGAPFAAFPFPIASSALRRGFVQLVKPSASVLAVSGLRIETLSRSTRGEPEGLNTRLHSDCSGKGWSADKGVSFESEREVEYGQEIEAL